MTKQQISLLLDVYKSMLESREADDVEIELVNSGEANFLASSKGHEGSAILAPLLKKSDYLHCHYRDKALMLARGISSIMFFYSALALSESHSYGRQMVSHMSDYERNVLSIVGPVGNNALQATGIAHILKERKDGSIIVCSMGDGTTQQGEVLEAIAEAKRSSLPILFFIHDNHFAISTRTTGKTFFSLPDGSQPQEFYAIPIEYVDGRRPLEAFTKISNLIDVMRNQCVAQIIVFNVERLDNHSNADDQHLYRSTDEIKASFLHDPIKLSEEYLLSIGVEADTLAKLKQEVITQVRQAVNTARNGMLPQATFTAERPLPPELEPTANEYRGDPQQEDRLTMLEAMRKVFAHQLEHDANVCLLGEDIEDGKGDVFGITKGLSSKYPGRVVNTALSEATIVGLATGMALMGKKPVAFIQFADFMPVAYNQIFSELGTMYWRTNGTWQCPVIIFAACGGYRPGLGPFHSQTNEATYVHIPGIDVYMPANAADAAGMLNAAFKSNRPSVFLYPKKLLNNGSSHDTTSKDIAKHLVPLAKARIVRGGSDITLLAWGNTVSLCEEAANTLELAGVDAEVIDLRTLKPYDLSCVVASVRKTKRLVVSHEDNLSCGLGGEIIAAVSELINEPIQVRRVTRADTYTPCNYMNQLEVLPSYARILQTCADLLGYLVEFKADEVSEDEAIHIVKVLGASPSDESVTISRLHVQTGTKVVAGDVLVDIEASKSAGEILAPYSGVITEVCVANDCKALVGAPLLKMQLNPECIAQAKRRLNEANNTKAILTKQAAIVSDAKSVNHEQQLASSVGMSTPIFKTGSRLVKNEELLKHFSGKNKEDIERRTGIKQRYWLKDDENITDVATEVVIATLNKHHLQLSDIHGIICATCSPERYQTPSMACSILARLYATYGEQTMFAYDINAACSGYLYALQSARDYLQLHPHERVLVITAENLSRRINQQDFDTAFLFADAASATIVYGADHLKAASALIEQIHLSAIGEMGEILNIPTDVAAGITFQGKRLFTAAVKNMSLSMHKCCNKSGIELTDIDIVIPHQANARILHAVEKRLNLPTGFIYSNIANYGNTSSSTIPIGLAEVLPNIKSQSKVGLCAFGGGFTAAAALITTTSNAYHDL